MIIHYTSVHRRVLALVRDRQIAWSSRTGPSRGFLRADGGLIPPSDLVALYELRNADLITVDKHAPRVAVTSAGMTLLARWTADAPTPQSVRSIRPAS